MDDVRSFCCGRRTRPLVLSITISIVVIVIVTIILSVGISLLCPLFELPDDQCTLVVVLTAIPMGLLMGVIAIYLTKRPFGDLERAALTQLDV